MPLWQDMQRYEMNRRVRGCSESNPGDISQRFPFSEYQPSAARSASHEPYGEDTTFVPLPPKPICHLLIVFAIANIHGIVRIESSAICLWHAAQTFEIDISGRSSSENRASSQSELD